VDVDADLETLVKQHQPDTNMLRLKV
jgi:hypothetical protein